MRKIWFILSLSWLVVACGTSEEKCVDKIDTSKIPLKLEVVRLEDELFACQSPKDIQALVAKHADFFKSYDARLLKDPKETLDSLAKRLWAMRQSKHMDTLYRDVKTRFDDQKAGKWAQIQQDFELAFKHMKHYYPQYEVPKIYTAITGLGSFFGGTDIFMDKKKIVISLELYYGKGARYTPPVQAMPKYIWDTHTPEAIVPACMMVLSSQFNATDIKDQTMLADMVYFGKAYAFVREMMPCLHDSLLTSYTRRDLANINDKENREYVWNFIIEKKRLFSNSAQVKAMYLNDAPHVAEINQKCPGRIGRWLGWRIIRKYQQKFPALSLQDLMKKRNARELFEASGYNGQ